MPSVVDRFHRLPPEGFDPASHLRIEPGTIADYAALARYHYKAGRPATWVRVLRMVDPEGGAAAPVGVLVVSMPTLNGGWRGVAWPDLRGLSRPDAARRLNAELRCISRVVVDPRWRGVGVASRLVRAYLADPLTPRTEAVASMGPLCGVFIAAGMREVAIPPAPADTRLGEQLRAAGIDPAELIDAPGAVLRRAGVVRALRAWAWRNRGLHSTARRGGRRDHARIARAAGERLAEWGARSAGGTGGRTAYVSGPATHAERPYTPAMEPTLTLTPGQRIRVTQRVPQGGGDTPMVIEGEFVRLAREKTGSWYAHTKDHKLWLDRLEIRKLNGELVALNLDQYSKVEAL